MNESNLGSRSIDETIVTDDSEKVESHHENEVTSSRTVRLLELLVFVFLLIPSMMLSFFAAGRAGLRFEVVAVATMMRDLSLVSLILFFLWRNDEGLGQIGWTSRNGLREVLLGVVLFLPFSFGAEWIQSALSPAGFSASPRKVPSFLLPAGTAQILSAFLLVVVVAVSEEVIFRGYLILRLQTVTSSQVAAVFLSSAIFSFGHGYEGMGGIFVTSVMGLMLGLVYLWRRSLVAPMVMHFLQDFIGLVLLPLSGIN